MSVKMPSVAVISLGVTITLAVLVGTAAWGDNRGKTIENSRRLEVNERVLKELLENKGAVDATTRAIQRSQTRTEKDVRAILKYVQGKNR